MKLYVVGRYISGEEFKIVWDIHGIFDSEEKALKACKDETYFIGTLKLNEVLPEETVDWPGAYYPKRK